MTEENKNQEEVKKEKRTQSKKNHKKEGENQTRKRNHKKPEERETRNSQGSIFKKSNVKIIPLGGLHEIGKNITVFEYEDEMIVVDCGISFPEDDMLGIDLVLHQSER